MKNIAKFAVDVLLYAFTGGSKLFYLWLGILSFLVLMMIFGSYLQTVEGMIVTNYNDQVSWGIYEAQFIFLVGMAAAAVTVIFPAYVYQHKYLKNLVIVGELLAISAIYMVLLFIMLHMGRPDRLWHMMPIIGIFNFPNSILAWDVMVVNGYFYINVLAASYYLYMKYHGRKLNMKFYKPLVYISICWAISIHTVTAFLINTLPARPMWFHSIMPIKFIASAFSAGPSMIIIAFLLIRKLTRMEIEDKAIDMLSQIIAWSLTITIFLGLSEVVTELYHVTEHSFSLQYLIVGHHDMTGLVWWYKSAAVLLLFAFIIFIIPPLRKSRTFWLPIACVCTFIGIWIDKGMGLVVPAFIPTPIGEFSEYTPSIIEIINVVGVWATGLFLFTVMLRAAIGISSGDVKSQPDSEWSLKSQWKKRGRAVQKNIALAAILISAMFLALPALADAEDKHAETEAASLEEPLECFESREVYSTRQRREIAPGVSNIKCSKTTGAVLWFGDPFDGTVPMGDMPVEGAYSHEEAVVKPRTKQLKWFMPCTNCHNGEMVPYPKDKKPRLITMHTDIVENSMSLQHGRGAIWCLDCHNARNRDKLINHKGEEISFNQPQRLCGKCHGQIYGDWRLGIHGKRIGMWNKGAKKRWWVCTECHNPHMVQVKRFEPVKPEPKPHYPRTRTEADYEKDH